MNYAKIADNLQTGLDLSDETSSESRPGEGDFMHISSLVVGLATDQQIRSQLLNELSASECFTVGEQVGNQLPVVLEVESEQEAERWFQWTRSQPGVLDVNVVFVSWE